MINGITISRVKFNFLESILSKDTLEQEYTEKGFNDHEIASKYDLTERWVSKLRKIYGIKTHTHYASYRNPLRFTMLSDYQKQFLYGTLLGDSCIAVQKSGTGYWRCRHSTKQEGYLLKQAEIMSPFTAKITYGERSFKKGGKIFPYIDARSYSLPQFTEIRQLLYPRGKKIITSSWVSKLTPTGFAYWFMDDGHRSRYSFGITTFDPYFRMQESQDVLKRTLGLTVSIHWNKDNEGKIYILKESRDLAWKYIRSELSNDLFYKIPDQYRS